MTPEQVAAEVRTELLHPEFGSIYQPPDGEAYLAYQQALADVEAEATRRSKMSENNPPVEGTVIESAKPIGVATEYPPMSKTEAGVVAVLVVGFFGGLGWLIKNDIKNQEEYERKRAIEREERDQRAEDTRRARTKWFDEQRKGGKVVLELRDGAYVAIPAEAYAKAEIKKKGEWL